jgi:hypothetical protein
MVSPAPWPGYSITLPVRAAAPSGMMPKLHT